MQTEAAVRILSVVPPTAKPKKEPKPKKARRGRGEGSIFLDKKRKLYVAVLSLGYTPEGVRIRKPFYSKDKTACQKKLDDARMLAGRGVSVEVTRESTGEFLLGWCDKNEAKARDARAALERMGVPPTDKRYTPITRLRSLHNYRRVVTRDLMPLLGQVPLAKLTPAIIEQQMFRLNHTPGSQRQAWAVLQTALGYAVQWGILQGHPMTKLDRPSYRPDKRNWLTPALVPVFRAAAHGKYGFVAFMTALLLGLRPGELLGLMWEDFDFAAGTVKIQRSLTEYNGQVRGLDIPKTPSAHRTLTVAPELVVILTKHRKTIPSGQKMVFLASTGEYVRQQCLSRSLARIGKTLGLKLSLYTLRHSCASLMSSLGAGAPEIARQLGHADGGALALKTYIHADTDKQATASTSLAGLLA